MEQRFLDVELQNGSIQSLKRKNVAAVRIAAGGAMGTPGETIIYCLEDTSICRVHGNYVYGDTDLDRLSKKLRLTEIGPKAWADIYMGAGHTLLVNQRDYSEIAVGLKDKGEEELWTEHEDLIWSTLKRSVEHDSRGHGETDKLDDPDDDLDYLCMSIAVYLEPSREQIQSKGLPKELRPCIPDHKRIYLNEMDAAPEDLCVEKQTGWEKVICVKKADFPRIIERWYPNGVKDWDWRSLLDMIDGDLVWFHGWGD